MTARDQRCDAIVLGAGVAGLTAAHDLAAAGLCVTVVDRAERCGGTHRSRDIGPRSFDVGSVFFEGRHPLFRMFPDAAGLCPPVARREERVAPDGTVHPYPFELREAMGWPLSVRLRAAGDLLWRRAAMREAEDAEAFCLARLGSTIYRRSGLAHYIERFHDEPASRIDPAFCHQRMRLVLARSRWPALAASVWRAASRHAEPAGPPRSLRVRPREGFGLLYDAIRRDLEGRGVAFAMGAPVRRLRRERGGLVVETGRGVLRAPRVVGAMPLDAMHRAAFGEPSGLEGIDLLTLFVSAGDARGVAGNVLYNFHAGGLWKRATIYSRIYGPAEGREHFAVEITRRARRAPDPQAGFADFRRHVGGLGLFSDDLALEGFDAVEDAYPLLGKGHGALVRRAVERLAALGVVPAGRQGRFEYLPTSMQVVARTRAHLREAGLTPPCGTDDASGRDPGLDSPVGRSSSRDDER